MKKLSSSNCKKKYLTAILGKIFNKTNLDSYEINEQDLFPLFVHLVCTVKTNKITKSQSVRSLPTCIRKYFYLVKILKININFVTLVFIKVS